MAGTPVISTGLGGAGELVHHNKTGLIFDMGDSKTLMEAISTLISNSDKRVELVNAAYHKAQKIEEQIGLELKEALGF